jgi:hypothetical protein
MLVYHQAVYNDLADNHLIFPMQCRAHGVTINDIPKMFITHLTSKSHAILVDDSDDPDHTIVISLHIVGVASAFTVRTPSKE